jgi:hypothetical protein
MPIKATSRSGSLKSIPEALEFRTPAGDLFQTTTASAVFTLADALLPSDRQWAHTSLDDHGYSIGSMTNTPTAGNPAARNAVAAPRAALKHVSTTCVRHIERRALVDIPAEDGSPHPHHPACIRSHAPLKSGLRFSLNARMPSR